MLVIHVMIIPNKWHTRPQTLAGVWYTLFSHASKVNVLSLPGFNEKGLETRLAAADLEPRADINPC